MNWIGIGRQLGLALLLVVLSASAQAAPPAAKEWSINNTSAASYGTSYELYNKASQIGYEKRTFGVDLGWVGHSGGYFQFMRKAPPNVRDHRSGPIGPTEDVALYNTKVKQWLKYQQRGDTEAELGWSVTPVYEWQIQDQTASNGRVYFALYNSRVNKYLIYENKNYGVNLGWLSTGGAATQSFSVALSPQPVVQGWVPYLGSFGQNTRGNLLTIQNASQTDTLLFVKPGRSTNNCSDPQATVPVGPRGSMTAGQMTTLYGSGSPRLPINFLACLSTPTPALGGPRFLNITYRLDN